MCVHAHMCCVCEKEYCISVCVCEKESIVFLCVCAREREYNNYV